MNGRIEVVRIANTQRLRPMAVIEAEIVAVALARYPGRGGISRAYRELGIPRSTFYRLLKRINSARAAW